MERLSVPFFIVNNIIFFEFLKEFTILKCKKSKNINYGKGIFKWKRN